MTDAEAFEKLVELAKQWADGHFTICRFTTNWRVAFYTPQGRCDVCRMFEGKTFVDAVAHAIAAGKRPNMWLDFCACHDDAIRNEQEMFEQFNRLVDAKPEGSA